MTFKSRVNSARRKIMQSITQNVGGSQKNPDENINPTAVKKVLICRPNHRLGNQLLMTPLIQEVENTFPGCTIDLFVKGGLAPILFANYKSIDKLIMLPKKPFSDISGYLKVWFTLKTGSYDVVINVDKKSSSGRLSTQFAKSKFKFFGEDDEQLLAQHPDARHIAKFPVYMLRNELEKCGMKHNTSPVPFLDLKLSQEEIAKGEKVLSGIVPNDKKAICLYTFATGEKCYSEEWWLDFYEKLKAEFQDYNIFEMLPIENISKINYKAPTYYSKDIREMGSVLTNSAIFIGADCGVMHLASAAKVPTIGLFSITSIDKYQPYNPGSVSVYTEKTDTQTLLGIIRNALLK